MKKELIISILALLAFQGLMLAQPAKIKAADKISVATATLAGELVDKQLPQDAKDTRVSRLHAYLQSKDSPMADSAEQFVKEADRLNLDWRLVAAISGNESYFGQLIPWNSYNAWGWAVYTGMQDGMHFANWNEGITTVSEGLRNDYINDGLVTVDQIGARYAADPYWSVKVKHFIAEIDAFQSGIAQAQTEEVSLTL